MKISNHSSVPIYTISGSSTARPLPEWLARKRKRSLKNDPEYASRIELLQDFEFEEASQCIRVSDDGQWVMSTGMLDAPEDVFNPKSLSKFVEYLLTTSRDLQTTNTHSLPPTPVPFFRSPHEFFEYHLSASGLRLLKIPSPPNR